MVSASESTIVKEDLIYGDEYKLFGFIAYDSAKEGKLPGVIVLHEANGFGEYTKTRATMLAELGYIAFAADLVGEGKGFTDIVDADASMVPFDIVKKKFFKAYDLLKAHEKCDQNKIAGVGYSYGGIVLTNLVRLGVDLPGVVNFYGPVRPFVPMEKGKFKGKFLFCSGDLDKLVVKEEIAAFKKEFDEGGVDYKHYNYPDSEHAFTNPESDEVAKKHGFPLKYNPKTDKESWADLQSFLKEVFTD